MSMCPSWELQNNHQNTSKCHNVTRESQAGFIDHIMYMIDEVNTPSWQNISYLASMHGNVTKHMNLWNLRCSLDRSESGETSWLFGGTHTTLQPSPTAENFIQYHFRRMCTYGSLILGSFIPKVVRQHAWRTGWCHCLSEKLIVWYEYLVSSTRLHISLVKNNI